MQCYIIRKKTSRRSNDHREDPTNRSPRRRNDSINRCRPSRNDSINRSHRRRRDDPSNRKCWNCNQTGHIKINCPFNKHDHLANRDSQMSTIQNQPIQIDENYRSRSPNRKSMSTSTSQTSLLAKSICDCFDLNREEKFSLKSELQLLANDVNTQSPNAHEPQTPKTQKKLNKLVVNYNSSNEELVNSMREVILQNLLINDHFCDYKISVTLYKPFIDMLKITKVINNLLAK